MKFQEIVNRLTGFSTPIFGVSWNPPESERVVAKRIIAELEDRRVLYNPSELEMPEHCVMSVIDIRRMLSAELGGLDEKSSALANSLRAMRAVCRKFLDTVQADSDRKIRFAGHRGHFANWVFDSGLGELRGVFGVHLAQIAAEYGIDVEDRLASILPASAESEEK